MPETLTIEIQDKGASSTSSAPPRPPSVPPQLARPRATPAPPAAQMAALPRQAAAPGTAEVVPHAATPQVKGNGGNIVETILERLGFRQQVQAFRQLFDYFAAKPQPSAPARPAAPSAAAVPAVAPQPAQPATLPFDALTQSLERGFGRVQDSLRSVGDYFASLPRPAPIVRPQQSPAAAPTPASAPEKPTAAAAPPAPPRVPPMPTAAAPQAPPRPPRLPTATPPRTAAAPKTEPPRTPAVPKTEPPRAPQLPAATAPRAQLTPKTERPRAPQLPAVPSAARGAPRPPDLAPARPASAAPAAATKAASAAELATGAEAAGGALATLSAAALPVGAAFVAIDAATKLATAAFGKAREAMESFVNRAHELSAFSPAIAGAEARADVRSLLDDMREAQDLGPDMARLLDSESDLRHEIREMLLPIKRVAVSTIADGLLVVESMAQGLNALLADVKRWMEENRAATTAIGGFLEGALGPAGAIASGLGQIVSQLKEEAAQKMRDDPEAWLRELYDAKAEEEPQQAAPVQDRPNIPLVNLMG